MEKKGKIKGLGKMNKKERKELARYYPVFRKSISLPPGVRLSEVEGGGEET